MACPIENPASADVTSDPVDQAFSIPKYNYFSKKIFEFTFTK